MPLLLVLAFVVVPLVELWVISEVAGLLTLGPTLLLLLVDSVLGAVLVRREGSRAWNAFRSAMAEGRVPDTELLEGVLLLFGGALLLTPGFVTDVVGLALVVPFTRGPIARLVKLRVVPIPLQVGTAGWNARAGGRAGAAGPVRPQEDEARRPTDEPEVEVLSIEREDGPVDDED